MKNIPSSIIISRTDSIGDVILALPMAKALKDVFPQTKVYFLGREYTRAVVATCKYVDGFVELGKFLKEEITIDSKSVDTIIHVKPNAVIALKAKKLHIKTRIGTTNRLYHWVTCNKLVRLSRKRSSLHEAQLNLKLLAPLGINDVFSYEAIISMYGFEHIQPLQSRFKSLIDKQKYNLILHPKSRGSAREWGFENFSHLINKLDKKRYKIFISGTAEEKKLMQPLLEKAGDTVTDISGLMPLEQFISFVAACDGLVACSTGPLHIAAALGKAAFGIYAPLKLINPKRWGPIGSNAEVFVINKDCNDCYKNKMLCHCIKDIAPATVKDAIEKIAD